MATLTCTIELNKTGGMTLTVTDGQRTQKIALDGQKLVATVSDGANTSTVTQTPDSVSIDCRRFSVTADSIACTSKQIDMKADATLSAESGGVAKLAGKLALIQANQVSIG